MERYKSKRIVDKLKWVIVDENGKVINRNPSEDELKILKTQSRTFRDLGKRYNEMNICEHIKKDGKICGEKLTPCNVYRERDKDGNVTGKRICRNCDGRQRYKNGLTNGNIRNSIRNHRTGNLNPNCTSAKGDNFEELTHIYKGARILSIENDCYNGPLDHYVNSKGIVYQTKGKWYDSHNQRWSQNVENEWNKEFDYLIFYCASKDGKIIERMYIFPKEKIEKTTGITIVKNPTDSHGNSIVSCYEEYRITDKEELEKVNKIWKKIIGEEYVI